MMFAIQIINLIFDDNATWNNFTIWLFPIYISIQTCVWLWLNSFHDHYSEVIMSAMASQIISLMFTQPFVQAQIKENIKAPHHWPWWGEFTDNRWIDVCLFYWYIWEIHCTVKPLISLLSLETTMQGPRFVQTEKQLTTRQCPCMIPSYYVHWKATCKTSLLVVLHEVSVYTI